MQQTINNLAERTARRLAFKLRAEGVLIRPNRWTGGAEVIGPGWEQSARLAAWLRTQGWRCYAGSDGLRDRFHVLPHEIDLG